MAGPRLVAVTIGTADPEILADQLWEAGTLGINELDGQLIAAFADQCEAEAAQIRIAPVHSRLLPPGAAHWDHNAWRQYATIIEVDGYVVRPPWLSAVPRSAEAAEVTELVIDPGDAFGSAAHVSTQQALTLFSGLVRSQPASPLDVVLDVGCGSGVLAVAAALTGASVLAIDNDPAAIAATAVNAATNNVVPRVSAIEADMRELIVGPTPVDLVFVNVTIDIHEQLAQAVLRFEPRYLIAAGLLETQRERLLNLYPNLVVASEVVDNGWAGIRMENQPVG